MPRQNGFQHQSYPTRPALAPVVLQLDGDAEQQLDFGNLHTQFGVRKVLLVHGTFAGADPFGIHALLRAAAEPLPVAARLVVNPAIDRLSDQTKRLTDTITADVANYSDAYRRHFQTLVGEDPEISRLEPSWSSENNHLARAALAVRLLNEMVQLQADGFAPENERVLLWGHSHAGNGFAILSNLLANDRQSVEDFFAAAGDSLGEAGEIARRSLEAAPTPHPMANAVIVVTFGTPVRYGWDTGGLRSLVHVIHHRPIMDQEDPAAIVPAVTFGCEGNSLGENFTAATIGVADVLSARQGDWVQAFAIAGTDIAPIGKRQANQRLGLFLEQGLADVTPLTIGDRLKVTCARWQARTRLHADGRNLLVDYTSSQLTRFGPARQAVLGHGIYTLKDWLPSQLSLVLKWIEHDGV
ncbi:MAG: hypothetical protein O3B13_04450 [Planctomycetota bacterium]|nr:hypothetical protein [Planctomycetota bacterium]MDA1162331.1 hypothetical protein [Planctomycetota bacterium]